LRIDPAAPLPAMSVAGRLKRVARLPVEEGHQRGLAQLQNKRLASRLVKGLDVAASA
jgi:hypothetical protein